MSRISFFVYLQATRGYISLPASRQPNTETHEYAFIQPTSGALIVVQVRTGKDKPIDIADLARAAAKQSSASAIAYSTSRSYIGRADTVELLSTAERVSFAESQPGFATASRSVVVFLVEQLTPACVAVTLGAILLDALRL